LGSEADPEPNRDEGDNIAKHDVPITRRSDDEICNAKPFQGTMMVHGQSQNRLNDASSSDVPLKKKCIYLPQKYGM
jgi:hypothetical protein